MSGDRGGGPGRSGRPHRQRPKPGHQPASHEGAAPDVRRYAEEMQAMLRQRDPNAYRTFIRKWRDLHQRGAVERLLGMDDGSLRVRLEHMILGTPALADLHDAARQYIAAQEQQPAPAPAQPSKSD